MFLVRGLPMRLLACLPAVVALSFPLALSGCPADDGGGREGEGEGEAPLVPDVACPGDDACSGALADAPLLAAASKRDVTPYGFEIARASYLRLVDDPACAPEGYTLDGRRYCGELKENFLDDCGRDGLCFRDEGYPGEPDEGEQDGTLDDYWLDCGLDRICPDNVPELDQQNGVDDDGDGAVDDGEYPGPDDGEGDGVFQVLWMAGYGNNRPAMSVKDPLWARAVVFAQGDSTLALCSVDAVGLFFDEQERIRARIEAVKPGAVDLFLLQASHSHEAPDTMGQWGFVGFSGIPESPGRSEAHMELVRQGCADAVVEALDALVAVDVRVGVVQPGVDGLVRDGRDPQIFHDDVTAISLEAQDGGTVVATLLNWGNHPESLDSDNNAISSDYAHAIRESLEQGLPETGTHPARAGRGGVAVYLQGAVGGIMGPNGFPITGRDGTLHENDVKSFARTDALGENVAELGFEALASAETLTTPRLSFSSIRYRARVENRVFHLGLYEGWFDRATYGYDPALVLSDDNTPQIETGVAVVRIGDLGFVTAPGELFPETFVGFADENAFGRPIVDETNPNPPDLSKAPTGPHLQERLNARYALPLGLCQDEMGYLVPSYDFKLANGSDAYLEEAEGDHYEETNSIGPDAHPLLLKHLDALFSYEAAR
jgi:hypothetical protein